MAFTVLAASAVVPSLLLLWYFISSDQNPEPRGALIRTFVWGAVICVPVIIVAPVLESLGGPPGDQLSKAFQQGVLGAGIPEEFFKLLVLLLYVWRHPAFDEPMDGIVYGATASLGFATLENILYVSESGLGTAIMRAVTAVPCHAFTGAIMGAYVGQARFGLRSKAGGVLAGYLAAVALHGSYDFVLFSGSALAFLALPILFFEIRWGRRLVREARAVQVLEGAVLSTVLVTPDSVGAVQAAVATSSPGAPSKQLSGWAITKLVLGGLFLSVCALAFLFDGLMVAFAEPGDLWVFGVLALMILGAAWGSLKLFRSGLSGPYATA